MDTQRTQHAQISAQISSRRHHSNEGGGGGEGEGGGGRRQVSRWAHDAVTVTQLQQIHQTAAAQQMHQTRKPRNHGGTPPCNVIPHNLSVAQYSQYSALTPPQKWPTDPQKSPANLQQSPTHPQTFSRPLAASHHLPPRADRIDDIKCANACRHTPTDTVTPREGSMSHVTHMNESCFSFTSGVYVLPSQHLTDATLLQVVHACVWARERV